MDTRVTTLPARRASAIARRWPALLAGTSSILVLLSATPAFAAIALPGPSQQPQAIDFGKDPLLQWVATAAPPEAFRTQLAEAVKRHPSSGEAEAGVAGAAAQRREARSALFPVIGAQVVSSHAIDRQFQTDAAIVESLNPAHRTDLIGTADQLLFDFGATGNRVAAGSAQVKAAGAEADRIANQTALRGIEAWYDVLMFQSLVELQDAAIGHYRQIVSDVGEREKAGVGTSGDVARAEAGLASAVSNRIRFARQLEQARAAFREVYGQDAPDRLDRPAPPASGAADLDAARTLAHATPAAVEAKANAEAAHRLAKAAKADRLPRLTAGLTGSTYDVVHEPHDYEVRALVSLRETFSTGGAEAARADLAKARARAADYAEDRVTAEAERDAGAAFADAQLLDRSLATLADSYRANRRARDVTVEQFRLSRGTLLDVLRVEQEYVGAATALLQGAVERDIARYTLMSRTGELLPLLGLTNGAAR
jgi:adhesin transport system outer membrane protein